jgi:hypothetical protein
MRRCIGLDVHREFAQVAISGRLGEFEEYVRFVAHDPSHHDPDR